MQWLTATYCNGKSHRHHFPRSQTGEPIWTNTIPLGQTACYSMSTLFLVWIIWKNLIQSKEAQMQGERGTGLQNKNVSSFQTAKTPSEFNLEQNNMPIALKQICIFITSLNVPHKLVSQVVHSISCNPQRSFSEINSNLFFISIF